MIDAELIPQNVEGFTNSYFGSVIKLFLKICRKKQLVQLGEPYSAIMFLKAEPNVR